MKNYLLVAACLLSTYAGQAQTNLPTHLHFTENPGASRSQNSVNGYSQLDSIHLQELNGTAWEMVEEYHFTYNQGREASRVEELLSFSEFYQYLNSYDQNGNLIKVVVNKRHSRTATWKLFHTIFNTYNSNNQLTSSELIRPVGACLRSEYTYSGTNLTQQRYFNITDPNLTIESQREEWTYDQNDNLTQFLQFYVSNSGAVVDSVMKETYEYGQNNNYIKKSLFFYYAALGGWHDNLIEESLFNQDNQLIQERKTHWNPNNSKWEAGTKIDYTYDSQDLLETKTRYSWRKDRKAWALSYHNEYEYDHNQLVSFENTYHSLSISATPEIIKEYFRSDILNSTNDVLKGEKWNIFPSPASHQIQLDIPENQQVKKYRIFDMNGRLVTSNKLNNGNSIHISSFVTGQYIIQVVTNETTKTMTFIKQ